MKCPEIFLTFHFPSLCYAKLIKDLNSLKEVLSFLPWKLFGSSKTVIVFNFKEFEYQKEKVKMSLCCASHIPQRGMISSTTHSDPSDRSQQCGLYPSSFLLCTYQNVQYEYIKMQNKLD